MTRRRSRFRSFRGGVAALAIAVTAAVGVPIVIITTIGGGPPPVLGTSHLWLGDGGTTTCVRNASTVSFTVALANNNVCKASDGNSASRANNVSLNGDTVLLAGASDYVTQTLLGTSGRTVTGGTCNIQPTGPRYAEVSDISGCVTFTTAPGAVVNSVGWELLTQGVRLLDFNFSGGETTWIDNPTGVSCQGTRPRDLILDGMHMFRAPGTQMNGAQISLIRQGDATHNQQERVYTEYNIDGHVRMKYHGTASPTTLPYNATAAQVQASLEQIAAIGVGNVAVTGGPFGSAATPMTVTFQGALANQNLTWTEKGSPNPIALETVRDGGGGFDIASVNGMAIVRNDWGPMYDANSVSEWHDLTAASSAACATQAAIDPTRVQARHVYFAHNKIHDITQTCTANQTNNCYELNHLSTIHVRIGSSWFFDNKFTNNAQGNFDVQTDGGATTSAIHDDAIMQNIFGAPCANQAPVCAVVSPFVMIQNSVGDTLHDNIVAYNDISSNIGTNLCDGSLHAGCPGSNVYTGTVVAANIANGYSGNSCVTSEGVTYGYDQIYGHDPFGQVICGADAQIASQPFVNISPPAYDFTLSGTPNIANLVPPSVVLGGKTIVCPAFDLAGNPRPKPGNTNCAAGAYE